MNILHDENSGCKGKILSLIVLYAMFQKLFYLCYLAIIQQNYPFSTRFFSFLYPFFRRTAHFAGYFLRHRQVNVSYV